MNLGEWKWFKEELPPLNTQILIISEAYMTGEPKGLRYFYSMSSGELTLENGIRVDSLVGREGMGLGYEPFLWRPMIDFPSF